MNFRLKRTYGTIVRYKNGTTPELYEICYAGKLTAKELMNKYLADVTEDKADYTKEKLISKEARDKVYTVVDYDAFTTLCEAAVKNNIIKEI